MSKPAGPVNENYKIGNSQAILRMILPLEPLSRRNFRAMEGVGVWPLVSAIAVTEFPVAPALVLHPACQSAAPHP
jgi:hypothetical protein